MTRYFPGTKACFKSHTTMLSSDRISIHDCVVEDKGPNKLAMALLTEWTVHPVPVTATALSGDKVVLFFLNKKEGDDRE